MSRPDFLNCLNCESPCYVFEYEEGEVTEAFCEVCGNDEADQFATSEDLEAMQGDDERRRSSGRRGPRSRHG